ncbi:hypothetical protein [Delftia acidovorans]|uniref:Uncharacterized protein n=1 Tax=Delftia acidovorans TaxID=80866 RepID=A0AAJ2R988_DELAC|nr:hypothetical protein [Delftia acidovorans]MDX4957895.1 hypothetical protein [Delftia acidovorans]
MTGREMLIAAGRAVGHDQDPTFLPLVECGYWNPRVDSGQNFQLAAALRISVEHNDPYDHHPWVCASVWTDGDSSEQQYLEDVPDESQRADRMRLAILRCAAAQAPKEGV